MPGSRHLPRWLRRWLRWRLLAPPRPGPLTLCRQEECRVLRYTVAMPPAPTIGDLAYREVSIQKDASRETRQLAPLAATFQFDTDPGVLVILGLVDVDTSGNRSQPSEPLAFTATDTVPPPQPGGFTIQSVEQIDAAPPTP